MLSFSKILTFNKEHKLNFLTNNISSKNICENDIKYTNLDSNCITKKISSTNYDNNYLKVSFSVSKNGFTVYFPSYLSGLYDLGKYYAIYSYEQKKMRYYTLCFGLNENIYNHFYNMLCEILKNNKIDSLGYKAPFLSEFKDNLNFFCRSSENKKSMCFELSKKDDLNMDKKYYVSGPMGLGLDPLNQNESLSNTHILFSGGTGIIPFIDFILFIFRYMIFSISNIKDDNEFSKIKIDKSFQIILFNSFPDISKGIFHDFCISLDEFDKKFNLKTFSYFPRISNSHSKSPRWTDSYVKEVVNSKLICLDEIEKIYICGPNQFNLEVAEIFKSMKLEDKIKTI